MTLNVYSDIRTAAEENILPNQTEVKSRKGLVT